MVFVHGQGVREVEENNLRFFKNYSVFAWTRREGILHGQGGMMHIALVMLYIGDLNVTNAMCIITQENNLTYYHVHLLLPWRAQRHAK